ncbi:MAG: adenylate/guanylate cyclase domain-containing protein [Arenibacterium sp.]
MQNLWRGNWTTQARIYSGLVLFIYALLHFLNIGLGLFSHELMQAAQDLRKIVTRSAVGTIVLYAALIVHMALGLSRLAQRATLRMPLWEAIQIVLGLLIPIYLFTHIVFTRGAASGFGVNDQMAYLIGLIFGTSSAWTQTFLLLIVWVHGCVGMHFWLRSTFWWQRVLPVLIALATLVPALALAGFLTEGRRVAAAFAIEEERVLLFQQFNWPDNEAFAVLLRVSDGLFYGFLAVLALVAVIFSVRKIVRRRASVKITYVDGPVVTAPKGLTLLEISRSNGVAHTALCGGRGRCTTCRVVVERGGEQLAAPNEAEARSLQAVDAPDGTRLACQIRPEAPITVHRVFRPDGQRQRAHASQGQEARMAVLFLDIRGFTERTNGQLPYDVVFLLNRFFDAIVPAITKAGGRVDKYLGDGLLALFEAPDEAHSSRAALRATRDIGRALQRFNRQLTSEGTAPVRVGIGLHLGNVVLGEIGAIGNAPRTIIGETVNAASRLEAMTKELGVELLISEPVLISAGINRGAWKLTLLELRGVREKVPALAVTQAAALESMIGAVK